MEAFFPLFQVKQKRYSAGTHLSRLSGMMRSIKPLSHNSFVYRSNEVSAIPYFFALFRGNVTYRPPPLSIAIHRYRKRAPALNSCTERSSKKEFPTCINRPSRLSGLPDSQGLISTFRAAFFLGTYVTAYSSLHPSIRSCPISSSIVFSTAFATWRTRIPRRRIDLTNRSVSAGQEGK